MTGRMGVIGRSRLTKQHRNQEGVGMLSGFKEMHMKRKKTEREGRDKEMEKEVRPNHR